MASFLSLLSTFMLFYGCLHMYYLKIFFLNTDKTNIRIGVHVLTWSCIFKICVYDYILIHSPLGSKYRQSGCVYINSCHYTFVQ